MTPFRLPVLLGFVLTFVSLLLWPAQSRAQLEAHQNIPAYLQNAYDGVNSQMNANVQKFKSQYNDHSLSKSEYQAKLKEAVEWRANKLFKIEYKEHLKGVAIGNKLKDLHNKNISALKYRLKTGNISKSEYKRRFIVTEERFRQSSRDVHIAYSERMQTMLEKATGTQSSFGSSVYETVNGKIRINPVTHLPVQNLEARAETAGGDNDKAGTRQALEKVKKLASETGIKAKISHGTIDIDEKSINTTFNTTSDRSAAKSELKSIAKSKRGVEISLKNTTNVSQRKRLNQELKDLRVREVAAKKQLKGSKAKSISNESLANKETYDHVRVKEWAGSHSSTNKNLTDAVTDLAETNDHMNKAAKALGKRTGKMTNNDVQSVAKAVKKILGPSASGQKGGSLNNRELSAILKGTQWESKPQDFRRLMSDIKSTSATKEYFHNNKKGLNELKKIARAVGKQTQAKRLNNVASQVRRVEARIKKSNEFLANKTGGGSKKMNLLEDTARKTNAALREAKSLTRDSMAGAAAHQKAAGIPQTNYRGQSPGFKAAHR